MLQTILSHTRKRKRYGHLQEFFTIIHVYIALLFPVGNIYQQGPVPMLAMYLTLG